MKRGTGTGSGRGRGNGAGATAAKKLTSTPLSVPRKPPQQVQQPVEEIVEEDDDVVTAGVDEPEDAVDVTETNEPQPILDEILNEDANEQDHEELQYEEQPQQYGDEEEVNYEEENLDYEGNYDEENVETGVVEGDDSHIYQEVEGVDGGILTGLKYDPLLPPMNDDPRDGKRIKKKGKGRNTESFDPATTLVRPDMRILVGPNADVYGSVLKHDDVVIVPDFFCERDDWSLYYKLIDEMRDCQAHGEKDSEWISWHEGSHLISKNPNGSPTYQEIQSKIAQYFNIPMQSVGTRFNWYRNSTDWKPFHHDSAAYNHQRAQNQNITVGVSFGSTRELAFLNVKNGTKIYFPQTNGMMFSFGRDVNIQWKHGVNALPDEEQDGRGRVSIILWGMADVIEEENSPQMVSNAENFGGVQRDRRLNNHSHTSHVPQSMNNSRKPALPLPRDNRLPDRGGDRPLFILSEDRQRMDRERIERERMDRERIERERTERERMERERDRQRDWERDRQRASFGRSRSRSRERRMYPPPPPSHPVDYHHGERSFERRDRNYYPPPLPASPPPYTMPPRDYPSRDDRGRHQPESSGPRLVLGVCFEFTNTGNCRYGDRCKFRHER